MSFKWKLYKVFNYILLVLGLLFSTYLCYLLLFDPPPSEEMLIPVSIVTLFLMMTIHSIINIIFSFKNFPDKALSGSSRAWNVISIVTNLLSAAGLIVFILAGAAEEFKENPYEAYEKDPTGKLILLFLLLLLFTDLFVLICQFRLASVLENNAAESISSMINSIGKE